MHYIDFSKSIVKYVIFILILLITSCQGSKKDLSGNHNFIIGKYTTQKPTSKEKWLFRTIYKSEFNTFAKMSIEFMGDSTYKIGTCSGKIIQRGNWRIEGDSILLCNRVTRTNKLHLPDKYLLCSKGYIFYTNAFDDIDSIKGGWKTYTTLLKIGGNYFDGNLIED